MSSIHPIHQSASNAHEELRSYSPTPSLISESSREDSIELPPLMKSERVCSASDICLTIIAVVFLPIWAIIGFALWCSNSLRSPSRSIPIEMTQAINVLEKSHHENIQVRSHTALFFFMMACKSSVFPLARQEIPNYLQTLFSWLQPFEPVFEIAHYSSSTMQQSISNIFDLLPEDLKAELAKNHASIEDFKSSTIDTLLISEHAHEDILNFINTTCMPIYTNLGSQCPKTPLMDGTLKLYQARIKSIENQNFTTFIEELWDFIKIKKAKADKAKNGSNEDAPSDVSDTRYIKDLLKRIWADTPEQVKFEFQMHVDQQAKDFIQNVTSSRKSYLALQVERAFINYKKEHPQLFSHLDLMGISFQPLLRK
ncbi:MAG: hypothetical protein FJZ56_05170 [Chlamydiae bacterium]|nr:hypothetical protein [Chlamydiota bacterium]